MTDSTVLEEIFADTCVLLNFVQREWERDRSMNLIESEEIDVIVSQTVIDELRDVSDRRRDIYEDLIDFLLEDEENIEEYDPADRRVYIGENDASHVRNLKMELSALNNRREVLRQVRRFVREAGRRVEYLESVLRDTTIDPLPPFDLKLAIDRILDQSADTKIVAEAAAWTAEGGSGVLVTLDSDDIFEHEEKIVELLATEQGTGWILEFMLPDKVISKTRLAEQTE